MTLKTYIVSLIDNPSSELVVVTYYRERAYKLYLAHLGKYTANLTSEKIDCSLLIKNECVVSIKQ